jgi:hypothetical protein
VNLIGTKGSGETITSLQYIHDNNYIVINCDRLFELPSGKEDTISKINQDKTLLATGFLTNGCTVKYDSHDCFAGYKVDFENILPYLVEYIRKNNIDTLGK